MSRAVTLARALYVAVGSGSDCATTPCEGTVAFDPPRMRAQLGRSN